MNDERVEQHPGRAVSSFQLPGCCCHLQRHGHVLSLGHGLFQLRRPCAGIAQPDSQQHAQQANAGQQQGGNRAD